MSFASDTAVRTDGDGRFAAVISDGWDVGGNANGGYLLAIAGRAMREASGRPDPVTLTAHYLLPGRPGAAAVHTEVVKRGRLFTTVTGALEADGKRVLQAIGTFGTMTGPDDAPGSGAVERVDAAPPALPRPEDCVAVVPGDSFPPPFMGQVDLRLHPEDAGYSEGAPSGEPRVRGWFRLRDGEALDTLGLLMAVDAFPLAHLGMADRLAGRLGPGAGVLLATDAFPPTAFNARLPVAWTPTVELTAHVRARPAPGWLRCVFTTRFVTGGFLEEDGEVWDATGRLVAQSRQLALVPRG